MVTVFVSASYSCQLSFYLYLETRYPAAFKGLKSLKQDNLAGPPKTNLYCLAVNQTRNLGQETLAESTWQCPPCDEDWDKGEMPLHFFLHIF